VNGTETAANGTEAAANGADPGDRTASAEVQPRIEQPPEPGFSGR
jgi:hypothetical protein